MPERWYRRRADWHDRHPGIEDTQPRVAVARTLGGVVQFRADGSTEHQTATVAEFERDYEDEAAARALSDEDILGCLTGTPSPAHTLARFLADCGKDTLRLTDRLDDLKARGLVVWDEAGIRKANPDPPMTVEQFAEVVREQLGDEAAAPEPPGDLQF